MKIQAEGRAVAPRSRLEIPHRQRLVVVPSVTKHNAHHIFLLLNGRGNVVGYIHVTTVKAGIYRVKHGIAKALAIEMELIKTGHSHIDAGRTDWFVHRELSAEIRSGLMMAVARIAYPIALPCVHAHFSSLEIRHAGQCFPPGLIRNGHLPIITCAGL